MDTRRFDFELPQHLIAQTPANRREDSKLLVYQRDLQRISHCDFKDIQQWIPSRTHLFRNTVSVLPARLRGQRLSGGQVECLLLHPDESTPDTWVCLLKPGKKLKLGESFSLAGGIDATLLGHTAQRLYRVQFRLTDACPTVEAMALRYGALPLPPYIARPPQSAGSFTDTDRYQTVYADPSQRRAVAAPTAGLHFTCEILAQLQASGVTVHDLILEVGLGTFRPIQSETLSEHRMHTEAYTLLQSTRSALHSPDTGLRLAVGTTTLRAMEDYWRQWRHGNASCEGDYRGAASLFLYPPAPFYAVDALLTNFHLPRSTLLCLVAAFLAPESTDGIEIAHHIYRTAIEMEYRFFSYGDAMLIL